MKLYLALSKVVWLHLFCSYIILESIFLSFLNLSFCDLLSNHSTNRAGFHLFVTCLEISYSLIYIDSLVLLLPVGLPPPHTVRTPHRIIVSWFWSAFWFHGANRIGLYFYDYEAFFATFSFWLATKVTHDTSSSFLGLGIMIIPLPSLIVVLVNDITFFSSSLI